MKTRTQKLPALLLSFVILFSASFSSAVISSAYSPLPSDDEDYSETGDDDIYAYPLTYYDSEKRIVTVQNFICGVKGHSKIDYHFDISEFDYVDCYFPYDGCDHNLTEDDYGYCITVDGSFDEDVILAATVIFSVGEEVYDWEYLTEKPSYVDGSIPINTDLTNYDAYAAGDLDGDGKITVDDAQLMLDSSLGLKYLGLPAYESTEKLTNNSGLSLTAARSILRYAEKLEPKVDSALNDRPTVDKNAPKPECALTIDYDAEKEYLTLDVSAVNTAGHHSVKVMLELPESLSYGYYEAADSEYLNSTGFSYNDGNYYSAAVASDTFTEDYVNLSSIEFFVDSSIYDPSDCIKATLVYDDEDETTNEFSDLYEDYSGNDDNDKNIPISSWLYYDETTKSAYYEIEISNYGDEIPSTSGKITLEYPSDNLEYTGFDSEDSNEIYAAAEEISDGVISVTYDVIGEIRDKTCTVVRLFFEPVIGFGFGTVKIDSIAPTYITDKNYDQIDFMLSDSQVICTHEDMEKFDDIEPSCTESGKTSGFICRMCGYIEDSEYIAPLGHKFKNGICTVCEESDETKVLFDTEYYTESDVLDMNIKVDNSSQSCKYEAFIEYPSDELSPFISRYSVDGETYAYIDGLEIAYYILEDFDDTSYLAIYAATTDGSSISNYANDIVFNFKFLCTDKTADSFTFHVTSPSEYDQSRVFLSSDNVIMLPETQYNLSIVKPKDSLSFIPDSALILDDDHTITVVPESTNGMTAREFKSQFISAIDFNLKDNELVSNGTSFSYNGIDYTVTIKGDAVSDGKIAASDARAILRIAAKLDTPDSITRKAADIDSDGKVSTSEARNVLRFAAKLSGSIYG